jgi:hypothetical protein
MNDQNLFTRNANGMRGTEPTPTTARMPLALRLNSSLGTEIGLPR